MPGAIETTVIPRLVSKKKQQETTDSTTPPTPALTSPPDLQDHKYQTPVRRILSPEDHQLFLSSSTHVLVVSFIFSLSDAVRDITISSVQQSDHASHPIIVTLLALLDEADKLLGACPPLDTGSRFGNPAFRDYLSKLQGRINDWHTRLGVKKGSEEIAVYLSHSFGDSSRIDYGSGHELNFALWLLCLRQMSLVSDELFPALALVVFPRYLKLMRDVQSTYYLEPAGSHGVWGLDDYQFLPFLFGASQLVQHKHIRPLSIHNEMIIEECSEDYLYLDQIRWVNATKTVQGLRWHSPMLDDISAAKSWAKVEGGMRKMFLAEVLGKLPVAQHFLFGSLLPAADGMSDERSTVIETDHDGHNHGLNSWGDCCGIKVPSAIGARQEADKKGQSQQLRRIPFD